MKRTHRLSHAIALATFLALGIIANPFVTMSKVAAVSGSQFQSGRIVDDAIFNNVNAMSVDQIQQFLNSKVPVCDNWGTQAYAGTTRRAYSEAHGVTFPLTCLKDYYENPSTHANNLSGNPIPAGGISAAQIIYNASQQYSINPEILITLIQKEQNLILDDWPWPTQYQSATGFGCPDTASCNAAYYGFENQVTNAAQQFRRYAANPSSYNYVAGINNNILYNPNSGCGAPPVYIQDQATASLYNYTPYQPNAAALNNLYGSGDSCSSYGNRNFWRYFNDWFGTTVVGTYASPLYKSSDDPTIYAVADGKKYPILNYAVMANYGYQRYPVAIVDSSFLANYATQPALTSLAKKANDPSGTIYMFDDGKRYPVNIRDCKQNPDGSTIANTTWGLDCFNSNVMISLPNQLIDNYTVQDIPLPQVILYNGAAWKIENAKKRRITNDAFVEVLGGWANVRWMKDINASQPEGKMLIIDNSVVKFTGSPTLYLFNNSQLYPIPGPQEYTAWNLFKDTSYEFPASYNASDPVPVSQPMQFFALTVSGQYYLLTVDGKKIPINNTSDWNIGTNYSTNMDNVLNQIITVPPTSTFRSSSGTLFTEANKNKYIFPTVDDFTRLGFSPLLLTNVSPSVENSLTYGGMNLYAGRLFKVSGNDAIRYVTGVASTTVNSTNYPGLPYNGLITTDGTTGARYPITGNYTP